MNISAPFIKRPIGTILLGIGLFLAGIVAYLNLPVASLPNIELPAVRISATLPGADPVTVAETIAAPLERHIGEIAGVNELTSTSQLGSTSISVQFDLSRSVDSAALDVQGAINAAQADLPGTLTRRPTIRKSNSASAPIMILALTSPIRKQTEIYDLADVLVSTRIAQVKGVAEVTLGGAQQPAIRIVADPGALATRGLAFEDVRTAITQANSLVPIGTLEGDDKSITVQTNGQMTTPQDYANVVVSVKNGNVVRVGDVATVARGTSNRLSSGYYNQTPAVIVIIQKTPDSNVLEVVDGINALLPELHRLLPPDVTIHVLNDRTKTIRRSVSDLEFTLTVSIALVMLVVLIFLRRTVPTLAAGVAVPLSLAGTVALMWLSGYSLNNMSLLALTISVGFVVDDAIVTIENCYRIMQEGKPPLQAALEGTRQIGFTIISISISLVAAFTPLLFMGGMIGRLLQEFAWTLTYAVLISAVVSLTVTPMVCARFIRKLPRPRETWLDRRIEPFFDGLVRGYERTLNFGLHRPVSMLVVTFAAIFFTGFLAVRLPSGLVPQGDTGLLIGSARVPPGTSFEAIQGIANQVLAIVSNDEDAAGVGISIGGSNGFSSANVARFYLSLKPIEERKNSIFTIITRLRQKLAAVKGVEVTMFPAQELQFGARQSRSQYQITLWSQDLKEVEDALPRVLDEVRHVPGVTDVNSDRENGSAQAYLTIDRVKTAKFGVAVRDVDNALNDSFSQRPVATIYDFKNQYSVILEASLDTQRSLEGLSHVYVKGSGGAQVPLSALTQLSTTSAPLAVNHQGQFPSITISFNTQEKVTLGEVLPQILSVQDKLKLPASLHLELAGETLAQAKQASSTLTLIIIAIISVYLVLGILYEDLIHPLTILLTLPSAGLGAMLTLYLTGGTLSIICFIGIILLIGIVKKNGIMLVDFALEAERTKGASSIDAIREACLERFRPILMTTMAAMLGALPLLFASGPGSELREPLGLTIIGGLTLSQLLTMYTTPGIYLCFDWLRRALGMGRSEPHAPEVVAGS